jgi:hypothetical protein
MTRDDNEDEGHGWRTRSKAKGQVRLRMTQCEMIATDDFVHLVPVCFTIDQGFQNFACE